MSDLIIDRRPCIIWATSAIALGILVYIIDRNGQAMFLPRYFDYPRSLLLFGDFGNILPTLTHTFSFIIVSSCVFAVTIKDIYFTTAICWTIELIMEIIQHPLITPYIKYLVFDNNGYGNYLYLYSLYGVFSWGDIIAIVLGALSALALMLKFVGNGDANEKH